MMKIVDEFCIERVGEIDFGFGEGRYKEQFGNTPSMEASVCIYAPTPRGILLNTVRTTAGLVDDTIRKVLDRTNVLPKVKKFWRARLAGRSHEQ